MSEVVERARSAVAEGDWQQAFDLLMAADADGSLAPSDLPALGDCDVRRRRVLGATIATLALLRVRAHVEYAEFSCT